MRRIGANARYFTDSASKVPIDVSTGDAAAGLAIDFYGRYQAETSKAPDGAYRMQYVTPEGGSSVSADPISLLRGAPHRELAVRFIEFVLAPEGQRLWTYAPGTRGGPQNTDPETADWCRRGDYTMEFSGCDDYTQDCSRPRGRMHRSSQAG